ncbi:MAG: nucleotidyltransferase domain-containing protein [Pelobium sp.]
MVSLVQKNLEEIKSLFIKYGAVKAYLFGSASNSVQLDKDSDIDFLFSFPIDMDYVTYADNYFNLVASLEKLLNRPVDLVAEKTLSNPYLIQSINKSKIQLL